MKITKSLLSGVLFLLLATMAVSGTGQIVRIIDESSQRPVENFFIYNENQSSASFSDKHGKADLSEFPRTGKIFLQHPSYDNMETTMEELAEKNHTLFALPKVIEYAGVTISANKWQQSEKEVPNEILALTSEDISFTNPQTAADALSHTGQVFVQKSQLGGGSPTLRGFAANAVLLVVDGIRLNNAIYRSGNLQNIINIDPNILERTEVFFGPGSVMYGSDALGGIMSFTTRTPRWSYEGTKIHANALLRYSSAVHERTGHFDLSVSQEKMAYFGSVSYTNLNHLRAGSNRSGAYSGAFERSHYAERSATGDVLVANEHPDIQKFSGYRTTNVLQKMRWRTSDRTDLTYSYFISTTSDIPRYDRLAQPLNNDHSDSLLNVEWYYGPQTWQMHAVRFNSVAPTGFYDQLRVLTSLQLYKESRHDRKFGNNRLRNRKEEIDIITLNLDMEKAWGKGVMYYGVDAFWNGVTSRAQRRDIVTSEVSEAGTRYPNGGSQFYSGALYGNYKWHINPKLILNTGARYSLVRLRASNFDDDMAQISLPGGFNASASLLEKISLTNQAVTGSISLIFNAGASTKLSGVLSSGFRSPNVDDIGKVFEINDDHIVIPNTRLKPEYAYNQEIGFEQKISDIVKLKITGYHSYLVNAIVRDEVLLIDPDNDIRAFSLTFDDTRKPMTLRSQVNSRRGARLYGGSAHVRVEIGSQCSFASSLSINEGRENETNEPLRHATPVFGRTSLTYRTGKFQSEFFIDYHSSRDPDDIPDSEFIDKPHLYTDEGSPGWSTANLRLGYSPSKHFSVESGMENLLDKHYRSYSSGISAPGRNVYVALRYSL